MELKSRFVGQDIKDTPSFIVRLDVAQGVPIFICDFSFRPDIFPVFVCYEESHFAFQSFDQFASLRVETYVQFFGGLYACFSVIRQPMPIVS
ncbi:unknown [Paraprevotella clara CAG:116]|nr:unknown [Paraprevotella clara CAG:116]